MLDPDPYKMNTIRILNTDINTSKNPLMSMRSCEHVQKVNRHTIPYLPEASSYMVPVVNESLTLNLCDFNLIIFHMFSNRYIKFTT